MTRVLVTRPEPGATKTSYRLSEAGYDAVCLPLTEISPLKFNIPTGLFNGLVATSAQAFRHLSADVAGSLAESPVYVVGRSTAQAANAAGFSRVAAVENDVAALMLMLRAEFSVGTRLLYLCGRVRRPDLESELLNIGITVLSVEVYDTISVSYSTDKIRQIVGDRPLDAILLSAAFSAQEMQRLLVLPKIAQLSEKSIYICISQRVADVIANGRNKSVLIAKTPDEVGLMRLLEITFPN